MSAQTKVLEYSALRGTPRDILVSIASYGRPGGTFTVSPSENAIAHRAACDKRTVRRWLKPEKGHEALLGSGELEIPHRGGSRRGDTHTYFIALIPRVEKGDIQLSPLPGASKPDISDPKGDNRGIKADTHVSPPQVVGTGLSKGESEKSFSDASFTETTERQRPAAASPPVGRPDDVAPPDNSSDDEVEYVSRKQMAADLAALKLKKVSS